MRGRPPENLSGQRQAAAALSTILGAVVLLFLDVLGRGESFYGRDVAPFFYPMKQFLAETVRGGGIPFWNPWVANGEPFFASLQPAVLYPPTLLLYLLPLPFAFDLLTIFHFPLAGCGFYLLLRRWGHGPIGAIVGALAFMLGGYFVSIGNFLNNLQTVAWIPWLFLVWDRYLESGSKRELVVFSLLAAVAFLGGEPQMLALGILVVAVHGLARVEGRHLSARRQVAGLGLAALLVTALTAVQLLPFLEYMGESVRTLSLNVDYSARTSLEPAALWQLLIPPALAAGPFGFTTQYLFSSRVPWLLSVYPGSLVILLAIVGLVLPRGRRWLIFWVGCGVLGILLAMGQHSHLYLLLHEAVPPFRTLRYPEKFYFLTALALPILAARGADVFVRPAVRRLRRPLAAAAGVAGVYVLLAGLLWALPDLVARLCGEGSGARLCERPGVGQSLYAGVLIWPAVAAATAAGLLLVYRRGRVKPALLGGALVALLALDLILPHRAVNPSVASEFYGQTPWAVQVIQEREPEMDRQRYRAIPLSSTMADIFQVRGAWELSNLYLMHEVAGANLGQIYGLLHQDGLQGIELRSVAETVAAGRHLEGARAVNFLRTAGVLYNADATPFTASLPGVEAVASHPELPLTLYRIPDPVPRAYLVQRFRVEPDRRRALWTAIDSDFRLEDEVVLDRQPSLPPRIGAGGEILEADFGREEVRLRVRTEGPAILVLTDRAYPGWEVWVDDRPAELYRANGYFRGVVLPGGEHQVAFLFRPGSLRIGTGITAATFLILGLVTLRRRRDR